ncbi:MAG: hypothetical protein Ct9H300mP16_09610 [Pseudomonadota bacterium]|nr:MAG: hypothetical protein Ct9H300mP16_09610 [Pseudomonadota bacterium]
MASSDGKRRDLVSTIPGGGWDFGISRHPYQRSNDPMVLTIRFTTGA